jgi:hypothetical protein
VELEDVLGAPALVIRPDGAVRLPVAHDGCRRAIAPLHEHCAFTPVLNVYAVAYLVGGAVWSAVRLRRRGEGSRRRVAGNGLIAIGGLTPAAGGLASRLGGADALPPTLLAGLVLIWAGAVLVARAPRSQQPTADSRQQGRRPRV